MLEYLKETELLDYSSKEIAELINKRGWRALNDYNKILNIYTFCKDEIRFGYNKRDELTSSEILKDGYGQCNTKSILLMSLLRGVNIQCRLRGMTVDKYMQKGILKGVYFLLSPKEIVHTWVEVLYNNEWIPLEGVILDSIYYEGLIKKFPGCSGRFYGYGVATNDFKEPGTTFNGKATFIQSKSKIREIGVFNSPDDFFKDNSQKFNFIQSFFYTNVIRHIMNRTVRKIR
ncbi:MAG: transglutaminase-like domain-containing protein [Clostridium sp.]